MYNVSSIYKRNIKNWNCMNFALSCNRNIIWAATWQNQHSDCAPSEDSDQPGHPPSLIRVFAVCLMGSQGPKLSSCRQGRLWSDWADVQADLSHRWARTHFVGFFMSWLIFFVYIFSFKSMTFHQHWMETDSTLICLTFKIWLNSFVALVHRVFIKKKNVIFF